MALLRQDTKRHVLFLIPTLTGGGAERVIVTLLKHLNRSKFRLLLAVVDTKAAVFIDQIPDDVEFIDLGCQRVRFALPKMIKLIWCRRPDVVFSTLGHLNLALAMVRTFLPSKIQFIARETNVLSYSQQAYRYSKLWAQLTCRYYCRVDLLVCQSRDMQQDLIDNFAFPREKTVIIRNPVDANFILGMANKPNELDEKHPDLIYLVAAGRLVPQKGFDLLINAMAMLRDRRVRLEILGEGPLLDELNQLARAKGVDEQVLFVGFQPNPYAWIARADGFVLSSRYEGFPNVVLEALACGTPVIATPAPGDVQAILEGRPECCVAEEISAKALMKAMSSWIAGARKKVPSTAVAPFALDRIVGQYEELLLLSDTTLR